MPNYSTGKIYKIVCNLTGETYYGSTVQKISQRMTTHRKELDCCSKPIIERGDYHYGLVEDFKCDNNEQLRMRERYYVDNNDCVNKKTPIRTKDELSAYHIVYRQEHKTEITEKKKVYRQEHKEHTAEQKKLYYEANKERILAQRKARYLKSINK